LECYLQKKKIGKRRKKFLIAQKFTKKYKRWFVFNLKQVCNKKNPTNNFKNINKPKFKHKMIFVFKEKNES